MSLSLLDAIVTPRKPPSEMTDFPSQINTLCLNNVPDRFKERLLACVNQQLEALGSLSTHVKAYGANLNEILEIVTQQEEQKVQNKIEKLNRIQENFDESVNKFTASFEELESTVLKLDNEIGELVTTSVSDIFRKEVAKAISYQIQNELNELVEENVTVERKLHRVVELRGEVDKVLEGSEQMALLYARGEAAYNGLYALGEGFESYSREELSNFMGSSFLEWLRVEKFSAKFEDMKGLVNEWESLLEREQAVRTTSSKTLASIMHDSDTDNEEINSSDVVDNKLESCPEEESCADGISNKKRARDEKCEKENKTCATTKRYQNAMKTEREKKRLREEKMKELLETKNKRAIEVKQVKQNATQQSRMMRSIS